MKFICLIAVLSAVLSVMYALDYRLCQELPKEKHCLIEYAVRRRWPHQVRYVFNWYTKKCFEIRWSQHCHPVSTKSANNFPSERECLEECSGWA